MKENGVQTTKCIVESEIWGQDYKVQTLVHPRSQNIEPWMVKPLSAGCVNTDCMLNIDYISLRKSSSSENPHVDQKQEINFVWP